LYGPGDVALAHTVRESLPIAEMMRAAKVLALAIADWCQVE
jgi:acetylornithine deacetylase/succinyl-diaminopimelate desuccinylase-like protein